MEGIKNINYLKGVFTIEKTSRIKKTAKTWLWEFSKRVVAVLLALYIIHSISAYAVMIYSGDYSALPTLLTENSETFRVCIGGYLLKATIENKIKLRRTE